MITRLYHSFFIVFQAALLFWWHVSRVGATAVLLIVGIAAASRFRIRIGRRIHAAGQLVFGIAFFCMRAADYRQSHLAVCPLIAEYLLFVQVFELLRCQRTATSNFLPGLGVLTLASTILALRHTIADSTLQWIYSGFICALILVLRPDLPRLVTKSTDASKKGITLLLAFSAVIGLGTTMRSTVQKELTEVQRSLSSYRVDEVNQVTTQTAGRFVDSAYLSSVTSVQLSEPEAPVFTVQSSKPPGYMRTLAFNEFDGWQWRNYGVENSKLDAEHNGIRSLPMAPKIHDAGLKTSEVFRLTSNSAGPYSQYLVNVLSGRGRLVPLPIGTAFVLGNARRPPVNSNGIILPGALDVRAYLVYATEKRNATNSRDSGPRAVGMPSDDAPLLTSLSNEICSGASTTREKARAIERYFANNFKYSLTSDPGANLEGRSAIRAFLEDRRDAHCEYFATATALLLRAQGISSRMCLGYLVFEMNDENDYFVAANRNAHAWAEAYDVASREWVIVESTPEIDDYVARFSKERADGSSNRGSDDNRVDSNAKTWLPWLYGLLGGRAILGIFGLAVVGFVISKVRPSVWMGFKMGASEQRRRSQGTRYVLKADRQAAKLGLTRRPDETYHQFANRIRVETAVGTELANWYEEYAADRYALSRTISLRPPPNCVTTNRNQFPPQ